MGFIEKDVEWEIKELEKYIPKYIEEEGINAEELDMYDLLNSDHMSCILCDLTEEEQEILLRENFARIMSQLEK